jgi:hypothetical protein
MKKKLKKPSVPKVLNRRGGREKAAEDKLSNALSSVPRITNETVTEHREEVLSSARKYIYPLQHSKHRIVRISIGLLITVAVAFLAFCGVSLYKFQSTSGFIYDVTRVLPFPVAKAGDSWVSYESYLFELRRNMHYYHTQQQADFNTKSGRDQLARLKKQAMAEVIQAAYVKQLAKKEGVTVSTQQVKNQVALVRNQNRLGNNERVFKEVLEEFWGWSQSDFERELRQELLQQAVVAKLDTATNQRADAALAQLRSGEDFAKVATATSEDPATKTNGGQFANPITPNDRNLAPTVTDALFKLKQGQTSDLINTGYTLEILKVTEINAKDRRASHIQFIFQPIKIYVDPVQKKNPPKHYIKV